MIKVNPYKIISLYRSGYSCRQIAKKFDCNVSVIKNRLRKANVKIHPSAKAIKYRAKYFGWKQRRRCSSIGSARLKKCGNPSYRLIKIKQPNIWRFEHRWKMERHLKRPLLKTELVHHKNDNTLDNRIQNLEIISRSQHINIHHNL